MPFLFKPAFKRTVQVSTIVALGFLVVSCSESKVSQCNKLIEVANQAVTQVQEVSQNPKPDNVDAMNKIADAADVAKSKMQELKLTDGPLKDFQGRFVSMYTDTSKATRDLIAAANAKDSKAAQTAFTNLKTATDQEGSLVNDVNKYCTAK
jgi:hypothetical protein